MEGANCEALQQTTASQLARLPSPSPSTLLPPPPPLTFHHPATPTSPHLPPSRHPQELVLQHIQGCTVRVDLAAGGVVVEGPEDVIKR